MDEEKNQGQGFRDSGLGAGFFLVRQAFAWVLSAEPILGQAPQVLLGHDQ